MLQSVNTFKFLFLTGLFYFLIVVADLVNSQNDRAYSSAAIARDRLQQVIWSATANTSAAASWYLLGFQELERQNLFSLILVPKLTVRTTVNVYLIKLENDTGTGA